MKKYEEIVVTRNVGGSDVTAVDLLDELMSGYYRFIDLDKSSKSSILDEESEVNFLSITDDSALLEWKGKRFILAVSDGSLAVLKEGSV